jgi:CBS domain-containing protein
MICPACSFTNLPGQEACTNCGHDLTQYDQPYPRDKVERSLMEDMVAALPMHPPTTVTADAPLAEAIGCMVQQNIGAVLVVDGAGNLVGILTERDLLKKVAGIYDNYSNLAVRSFMTPRPETVSPTDPLNFALHRMDAGGYRHIPVVENGRPVSVVSVRDMMRHITRLCRDG